MTPEALIRLLDATAASCQETDVDGATIDALEQLAERTTIVRWEIAGLDQRIADASRKVNGTPVPQPTKPLPKKDPPPKDPPPKKEEGR